jgi:hypothetical protein
LITSHIAPSSEAFFIQPGLLPTTTILTTPHNFDTSDNFLLKILADVRDFDYTMLGLQFYFVCLFAIISVYLYKRLASRRSLLYVELLTASDSYFLRIMKLPDRNRFHSVSFPRSRIRLVLTDYLIVGVLTRNRRALTVEDNLRHLPIPLPKFRILPFWQTTESNVSFRRIVR